MKTLRDFPTWLFNDIPERQPMYAYRSLMVIVPIATVAIGFFVWSLVALSLWIALTAGVALIAPGFVVVLRLVNRIAPKKLPADKEML